MAYGEGWDRFSATEDDYAENDDYINYEGDEVTAENIQMDTEAQFYEGD